MAKPGRPSAIATEEIEIYNAAVATVKDIKKRLDSAHDTLTAAESRLSAGALETLGDDKAFAAIEAEASKARAAVRQLALAHAEAEKRRDDAERTMRLANSAKLVSRALKTLAERDEAGRRVQDAAAVLAREFDALLSTAGKARDQLAGLIPESQSRGGFALHELELGSLLAKELWRVNPSLPGVERPLKLDGSPGVYTPETAPTFVANLQAGTELARQILGGSRNYGGQTTAKAEPKRSLLKMFPWRGDRVALDEAREQAASNPTATMKAARAEHERRQHAFAALGDNVPEPLPGESEAAWLERVSRPQPMTDAERAALHAPPRGPTRTAEEVMAEVRSQGGYSTLIDARQSKPEVEDW